MLLRRDGLRGTSDYPALGYLCRGYVNEDWPDDYGDVWTAVDAFVDQEPDKAPDVPVEIDALLAGDLSEDDLHAVLRDLSCNYWPYAKNSSYTEWLGDVSRRVRERLGS